MKNSLLVVIFASFFILPSCTDEDSENPAFRLKEFNSGYAQSNRSRTFLLSDLGIGGSRSCCMVEYKNGKGDSKKCCFPAIATPWWVKYPRNR